MAHARGVIGVPKGSRLSRRLFLNVRLRMPGQSACDQVEPHIRTARRFDAAHLVRLSVVLRAGLHRRPLVSRSDRERQELHAQPSTSHLGRRVSGANGVVR